MKELDAAIAPCKVMVRPLLHGISRLCTSVEVSPLDKDEIDSGATAWGAVLYSYGGMLNPITLATAWTIGVSIPRFVEYFEKQAEKKKAKQLGGGVVLPLPEREAKPEVNVQ